MRIYARNGEVRKVHQVGDIGRASHRGAAAVADKVQVHLTLDLPHHTADVPLTLRSLEPGAQIHMLRLKGPPLRSTSESIIYPMIRPLALTGQPQAHSLLINRRRCYKPAATC